MRATLTLVALLVPGAELRMKLGERAHLRRQTRRAAAFVTSLLKIRTVRALSQTQQRGIDRAFGVHQIELRSPGALGRHCFRDDLGCLRRIRDRIALRAECAGKGRKVGVGQVRTARTLRKALS